MSRTNTAERPRWDRHSSHWMMIYPERALVLSEAATEIIRTIARGEMTITRIVDRLVRVYDAERSEIETDLRELVDAWVKKRSLVFAQQ